MIEINLPINAAAASLSWVTGTLTNAMLQAGGQLFFQPNTLPITGYFHFIDVNSSWIGGFSYNWAFISDLAYMNSQPIYFDPTPFGDFYKVFNREDEPLGPAFNTCFTLDPYIDYMPAPWLIDTYCNYQILVTTV